MPKLILEQKAELRRIAALAAASIQASIPEAEVEAVQYYIEQVKQLAIDIHREHLLRKSLTLTKATKVALDKATLSTAILSIGCLPTDKNLVVTP